MYLPESGQGSVGTLPAEGHILYALLIWYGVYESLAEVGADGEHGGGIEMANKIVREIIHAKGIDIGIYTKDFENEYISLTDIAKYRNDNDPRFVIQNWMRNRNTVEFLAVWEELHNPDFNRVQFEAVRSEAGLNRFVMTPTKWIMLLEYCQKQADMAEELMHIAILLWHLLHGFLRNFSCI